MAKIKPYILEKFSRTETPISRYLDSATHARFYWRLRRRRGGKIVADGSEDYSTKSSLGRAVMGLPFDWKVIDREWVK